MGQYAIKMPDIGEGIAEVELVEWRVKPGDSVVEDQILADVMTDKATVEIPSPVAGKVLELGGKPGAVMAVGSELIRLQVAGAGNVEPKAEQAASAAAVATPPVSSPTSTLQPAPIEVPAPEARESANGASVMQRPKLASQVALRAPGDKPITSPAVRQRAWELGIELQFVHGSGPIGRITHEDLDSYLVAGGQPQPVASTSRYAQRHGEETVPVIGLRRKIAQKMQEAKRRIPHFTYVEEVDVTELEALRARLNAKGQGPRLTVLPFLMRAVVTALRDFPQLNAHFDDEAGVITRFGAVHLGIATQTAAGLLVPVVRQAQALDLWNSAKELVRVTEGARTGKATRAELSGSTITITSLGALGGIVSTPIINHPEVAIVGVNRIVSRPMMSGAAIVARQMMNLSSSFDHRVVDGQQAAEFVQALRALLECPALLFVEGAPGG